MINNRFEKLTTDRFQGLLNVINDPEGGGEYRVRSGVSAEGGQQVHVDGMTHSVNNEAHLQCRIMQTLVTTARQ